MSMSFTMNYKLAEPGRPVRFEAGEPLFQAIPLRCNPCADLEKAAVSYQLLAENSEVATSYREWDESRRQFHARKGQGGARPDGWQKDYFHGRDASGRPSAPEHATKVKPPIVRYSALTSAGPEPARPSAFASVPPPSPSTHVIAMNEKDPPRVDPAQLTIHAQAQAARSPGRRVDNEWRRWIAENLVLDSNPASILATMVKSGFDREHAAAEIELAASSPYLKGTERLRNRLKKRDWLLATYRKLERMRPGSGEVERRHRPSRDEFFEHYYAANRPVILTGAMDDWPALWCWSLADFAERFGDREVEVQYGRTASNDYEIESKKFLRAMKFADYLAQVRDAGVTNDFYMTANNNSKNKQAMPELWDDVGRMPAYLNGDDPLAGFLWVGPAGTITPFHHDLTNNLVAQVVGRKRVLIVPSWDMPMMNNLRHVFSSIDGRTLAPAPAPPPGAPQVIECVIGPGEALFLPIGCMHFVEALDVSISMSFTNFVFDNNFHAFYTTYHDV